ncbi:hypothetical protein DDB_G0283957 [Dictyostelium discoideum AX4]|uniref:DNA mismatch repair proteins mutS family domain-containing protein n=1 Tax=Dictyostelium discoideum TaxID=44689 RepID=Q54QB8_DICDI|nr:hypothetical protein DDB_G0283957 [Dictyostelium discoideum AX4]EAL65466.1 hypothetical protein DDB_G0283957 [Dictyostelium discoideum AX4]|eukprot:XP_638826.1 hypothetical protein DDB_G0283957 [Dictyostelium discoideum AX4]
MNNGISKNISFYKKINYTHNKPPAPHIPQQPQFLNNTQKNNDTIINNNNNADNDDIECIYDDYEFDDDDNNNDNDNDNDKADKNSYNNYIYKEITLNDFGDENDNESDLDDLDFDFEPTIIKNIENNKTSAINSKSFEQTSKSNHKLINYNPICKDIDENDLLLISKPKINIPMKTPPSLSKNNNTNSKPMSSLLNSKKSTSTINTPKINKTFPNTIQNSLRKSGSVNNENNSINSNIIKNKTKNHSGSIVAICENRTREIGYSSYNIESGEIETGQFCDSQTYFHLYTKLYILNPSIIVIPPIEQNREMVKLIENAYPNVKIIPIIKKLFNENDGISLMNQYCLIDKISIIEKFTKDKVLSLSSFNALIKYLEQDGIMFVKNCIRIKYSGSENSMQIDAETIKNLELIHSSKDGSRNCTLYQSINNTSTSQGSRLLISAIVQPSNDFETIKHRQNAIKQLLSNQRVVFTLTPLLSKIQDIDKTLLLFSQQNKQVTIKSIETSIKCFIDFKNIFELLPKISNLLNSGTICDNPMLNLIKGKLNNETNNILIKESSKVLNVNLNFQLSKQDQQHQQKEQQQQQQQQVNKINYKIIMYIKDGVNGLLDVCKKTYKEITDDINKLTKYYKEQFKLPQLKLQHCQTKGYYYSLPCKNKALFHLPNVFVRSSYRNQKYYLFSEELTSLSRRSREVFEEIIILSAQSIEKLIEFYRSHISELYNISESISLLDFLVSGALYSLQLDQSVCPEIFNGKGPLAIKSGYHPLQLKKSKKKESFSTCFVPNDTLINETASFQLIHGCNMSGKSTYIQQVALLTIVAHIGYFLPAEFATVPIVDQIISRLGTSDNIQSNASTFMTEMKEISYILENTTESSLVIIDELGRGTSNMDGSSIAWSISEHLSMIGCYTLFVTHYQQLLNLATFYPNIRVYHFQVSKDDSSGLKYNYLFSEGVSSIDSYGVETAELAGIDSKVIQSAKTIRNLLESKSNNNQINPNTNNQSINQYHHPSRDSYQLLQKLLNLKFSKLSDVQLKNYLLKLKEDFNFS